MIEASPTPATAEPAAFFAAPPQSPADLVAARQSLLSNGQTASKFEDAVREARDSNNSGPAATGSWVCGHYQKALDLVEDGGELQTFIKGSSLLELGRVAEANEVLAAARKAKDPELAFLSMHALDVSGDADGLAKALKGAKLNSQDARYFAGRLTELAGDYETACATYEEILSGDPSHFASRFRLAVRADLHGDEGEAIRHYESLLERRPIPASVLINLGVNYEDKNEFEKACGCYAAVLRRDANHPLAKLYYRDAHESLDMFYDEDLERKEDRLMQVLRTPISDFELSVRARNCLINMDIRTLGDLVSHSEPELLEFKNFGETSLNEIKRVLHAKGLRLGMRREDGSFIIPDEFDSDGGFDPEKDLAWLGKLSDDQRDALDLQISTLNLSVRCHRALVERLNLQRVSDVLRFSEEDLLSMPNFGITSLNELASKLNELGLHLRTGRGDEYGGYEPDLG